MTTKTDKASVSAQQTECLHLRKFKDFLREAVVGGSDSVTTITEQRNCMRSSNETYPVTGAELKGELIMYIWNQLQTKQCPYYFQLPILRALVAELGPECQNSKDNDFLQAMPGKASGETLNEVQYDLVKLQKFIANNLEKFLMRLTDNAEAANLRTYADDGVLCESTHECQCSESSTKMLKPYVVGSIKNKPRKMEDRYVCLERYSEMYDLKSRYSFYGVFDGHSGPLTANYSTCQIPYLLAKQLKSTTQLNSPDDYRLAFETAFLQADEQFTKKGISSGTTAVCALISEASLIPHLYVAWVGDSRALLVGSEASLQLVKSHKPDSPDERKRIEDAGGTVMHVQGQWRVNGFLNVARSIGDYSVGAVIAEPDFVDIPLTTTYDFLVLGTDGLWDHVTEAAIVTTIYGALEDEEQNVADIPKLLIEMAKDGDSQDNITVVIVFLKQRLEIVEQRNSKNLVP